MRERRVVIACRVEYPRLGEIIEAFTEDISRHGMFVRTQAFLPAGAVVGLRLHLPGDEPVQVIARVAHVLPERAARVTGRHIGMGFEFLDREGDGGERLKDFLDETIAELTPPPKDMPRDTRALVVHPDVPMLERLCDALGREGFSVEGAQTGTDAYAACVASAPDVLVTAAEMPGANAIGLLKMFSAKAKLADLPVVVVADDAGDMARLELYRAGARDYIPAPFTDDELAIRVRRVALSGASSERVSLRGTLAEIGLPTLLSLLEFERKSGILVVLSDADLARLFVARGRLVKVDASVAAASPRERLFIVLGWRNGNFEFSACDVVGEDEVRATVQHLLIEHARLTDETGK